MVETRGYEPSEGEPSAGQDHARQETTQGTVGKDLDLGSALAIGAFIIPFIVALVLWQAGIIGYSWFIRVGAIGIATGSVIGIVVLVKHKRR